MLKAPEAMQVKGRWCRLRASVCHIGDSFNAGHYVCHVPLEASEKWVSYNDGAVRLLKACDSSARSPSAFRTVGLFRSQNTWLRRPSLRANSKH